MLKALLAGAADRAASARGPTPGNATLNARPIGSALFDPLMIRGFPPAAVVTDRQLRSAACRGPTR